jgi:hypothetical protein
MGSRYSGVKARITGEYRAMALAVVKDVSLTVGSLDFSLWISPLLGEIPPFSVLLVVYALWIYPLLACVIV